MLFSSGVYPRWNLTDQNAPRLPYSPGAAQPSAARLGGGATAPPPRSHASQPPAKVHAAAWAVLAFAPEDARWADWLHRNLHGHPVPAAMVDSVTSQGFARQDCLSVFPDRRDPQHPALYPQALQKSGYLVVVCSPDSAHCPELDAKICAFKSAGGEGRIIALLVESEPESGLEMAPKTAPPEWLPAWLRWRVVGDTLALTDAGEPLIVDARPGRASLKEVRDLLLSALLEIEPWELEVVGFLNRPLEIIEPAPKSVAKKIAAPEPSPLPPPKPNKELPRPQKIDPVILTAAACVSLTLVVAWWAFGRMEDSRSHDLSAPVQIKTEATPARIAALPPAPTPAAPEELPSLPEKPVEREPEPPAPPIPAASSPTPPAATPVVSVPVAPPPPAPAPVPTGPRPPQPGQTAMTSISAVRPALPFATAASAGPAAGVTPLTYVAPRAPVMSANDTAARNAMSNFHRLGDIAVERRLFEEALVHYEKAVDSVGTAGQNASPDSRTEAALLCRKLGTLQLQMASTAEARDTFVQGRKILLQIKKEGHWNASRSRVLAELETSLRRLPRD